MSNLNKFQKNIKTNYDFFLIVNSNEVEFISGFNGSCGIALISKNDAYLFTDGRYIIQASNQLNLKEWFLLNCSLEKFLEKEIKRNIRLWYNPWFLSYEKIQMINSILLTKNGKTIMSFKSFIDPSESKNKNLNPINKPLIIKPHPFIFSGEDSYNKCSYIIEKIMKEKEVDLLLLTNPESILWLLNFRVINKPYVPTIPCYALLHKDLKIDLFMNIKEILFSSLRNELKSIKRNIFFHSSKKIFNYINNLDNNINSIWIDKSSCPSILAFKFEEKFKKIVWDKDPVILEKSRKNSTEVLGSISCHIRDSIVMTNFLSWIDFQKKSNNTFQLNEISCLKYLEELRSKEQWFACLSFPTISAFDKNAAIVHYNPLGKSNAKDNKIPNQKNIYLVDSGSQYFDGTTDITRTVSLTKVINSEHQLHYTLVLKGLINLSKSHFPYGTNGSQLDALARSALWNHNLDYEHSTGHGVGSFLNVHEGPQSINQRNTEILRKGMIISNEPGYYCKNSHGIRIENLMIIVSKDSCNSRSKSFKNRNEILNRTQWLGFETLTLVPFDNTLIDKTLLNQEELLWINNYYKCIRNVIFPLLKEEMSREWILNMTEPL